jgi:hypothetical protein
MKIVHMMVDINGGWKSVTSPLNEEVVQKANMILVSPEEACNVEIVQSRMLCLFWLFLLFYLEWNGLPFNAQFP